MKPIQPEFGAGEINLSKKIMCIINVELFRRYENQLVERKIEKQAEIGLVVKII